jgi:GT2 family glycosyltransferase/nucleoside-diphosphate-sugar epimerase
MTSASVVIVSYHTGPALWLAIDSVLAQPECKELIIVDNGNTPGDLKRLSDLKDKERRIRLLTGQGNVGFGKGCNLGAKWATGEYILLLNPDSMLPLGGLASALKEMEQYPANTLAGCYLLYPDGKEQRGGRRALLTPESAIVESLGLHRYFSRFKRLNYHEAPMPEMTHYVPAISGAFMLVSRDFYHQLGGIDEGYFLHMEDMDFCWRVHEAGGQIICMPAVRVIHFRSTSEVSNNFIEKCKAKGFIRYLNLHFKNKHSALFLFALSAGIWLRYFIKIVINAGDRFFTHPMQGWREIARIVQLYRSSYFGKSDHSLAGKTIIVTGASGQVGLCLIGNALAHGANVIAVANKTRITFAHPNLTWLFCDLNNAGGMLEQVKADVLIHAAALWLLPPALPKLLATGIKRVIAFSSTSVVGKSKSRNRHEKQVVQNLKIAEAETVQIAGEENLPVTLLRPTMIYGIGLDGNITRLANVIRRFGIIPVYGKAEGWRHPVQATDLADAAIAIIDNEKTFGKSYNLGGRQTVKYRTMVEMLFVYLGKKPKLLKVPFMPKILDALGAVYQMGHVNGEMARRMNEDLLFDIKDAIDDFGYHPQGFLQGEIVL